MKNSGTIEGNFKFVMFLTCVTLAWFRCTDICLMSVCGVIYRRNWKFHL